MNEKTTDTSPFVRVKRGTSAVTAVIIIPKVSSCPYPERRNFRYLPL